MMKLAVALTALSLLSCGDRRNRAEPDPPVATSTASSEAVTSASAASVAPPAPPPKLVLSPMFDEELTDRAAIFSSRGSLFVGMRHRVGRITSSGLAWIGSVEPGGGPFGHSVIIWVGGTFPDRVDVVYVNANDRAPAPRYTPLTGKGRPTGFALDGSWGWLDGVVDLGESTIVAGFDYPDGYRFVTVRGPDLKRAATMPRAAGCTEQEVPKSDYFPELPAVRARAVGAASDGTLVVVGNLCGKRGPAAEVWDAEDGKPKIHSLKEWIKDLDSGRTEILAGKDGVVWIAQPGSPVVRLQGGTFAPLPDLPKPLHAAFVSAEGQLHASDGERIYRFEADRWAIAAELAWPSKLETIALHEGAFWASAGGNVFKLEKSASIEVDDGCKTPFVDLYAVSPKVEPTYKFPTTAKALATFDRVKDIKLVEFTEGVRRLGIVVPDKAVGEAVAAHVRASMKDESPRLVCYQPSKVREIPIKAAR
jgi:hypothetical protein